MQTYVHFGTAGQAIPRESNGTRWVAISEGPGGEGLTLFLPDGDAEIIATTGVLIDALETLRRGAMERLAEAVKADVPDGVVFAGTVGQFLDHLEADWTESDRAAAWGR
jgi:hypothetical protein